MIDIETLTEEEQWALYEKLKFKFEGGNPPYDPSLGDNKVCFCGHTYYRHFDSYEQMDPCGCKYCPCCIFGDREKPEEREEWEKQFGDTPEEREEFLAQSAKYFD